MFWILFIISIIISYLIGSIPFGLLISKSQKKDIRQFGSGNIGATNVFRVLGPKWGILAFVLDFLKGLIPVIAVKYVISSYQFLPVDVVQIIVGLFAVVGHMFPVYLKFKGGKGVATGAGIVAGIMPVITLILIAVWALITFTTRYVSVASISVALLLPVMVIIKKYVLHQDTPTLYVLFFCILIAVFVIVRHKSNIARLMKGEENRFGRKKEQQ